VVAEEGGYMGDFWQVEHEAHCVLVDVAGLLVIQYHAKVLCSGHRGDFDVLSGDK